MGRLLLLHSISVNSWFKVTFNLNDYTTYFELDRFYRIRLDKVPFYNILIGGLITNISMSCPSSFIPSQVPQHTSYWHLWQLGNLTTVYPLPTMAKSDRIHCDLNEFWFWHAFKIKVHLMDSQDNYLASPGPNADGAFKFDVFFPLVNTFANKLISICTHFTGLLVQCICFSISIY